jgi:hypothetical protein
MEEKETTMKDSIGSLLESLLWTARDDRRLKCLSGKILNRLNRL